MDSIADLQRQVAALQQQNQELRAGKSNYANQAELLRQQQALQNGSAQDTAPSLDSSDWWSHMGFGAQATQQTQATPAQDTRITMTQAEFEGMQRKMVEKATREAAKTAQNVVMAGQQQHQTMINLQAKLAAEHPDLVDQAPIIDRVWKSKLMENPKATPEDLFNSTIQDTRAMVDHVLQTKAPQTHPYGVQAYGAETPPWTLPQRGQQVADDKLFQPAPGNEMPTWKGEINARNRHNRSKALNVYVPMAGQSTQAH